MLYLVGALTASLLFAVAALFYILGRRHEQSQRVIDLTARLDKAEQVAQALQNRMLERTGIPAVFTPEGEPMIATATAYGDVPAISNQRILPPFANAEL